MIAIEDIHAMAGEAIGNAQRAEKQAVGYWQQAAAWGELLVDRLPEGNEKEAAKQSLMATQERLRELRSAGTENRKETSR